ncbi:MAG: nucleotidyltransferase domain-containing protein, partial [Candidatus Entotheonellia bacterium]
MGGEPFDAGQIRWAVQTGLGPLLYHTAKADPAMASLPVWPLLRSADLLARLLTGEQLDAMREILEACAGVVPPVTLLKGISVCTQYYPAPHLRPMRDIDLWVEEDVLPVVESLLGKRGYRQPSHLPVEFYRTHHHTMPYYHPQRGVWVEVHRRLVSARRPMGADELFGLDHLRAELRPSEFQGKEVRRLSDELQVVYTASHWARQFQVVGGLIPMLDVIYLLQHAGPAMHWDRILDWVRGSAAGTHLYLMLSYLHTHRLIELPAEVLHGLFDQQRACRRLNATVLHSLIDRYLANGKS